MLPNSLSQPTVRKLRLVDRWNRTAGPHNPAIARMNSGADYLRPIC